MNRIPYVSSPKRLRIEWPDNARIALYVGLNIEYFDIARENARTPGAHMPDMVFHVYREYGARTGVFRIMDALDRVGMKASVLLNAEVCDQYPDIIEEGNKRQWEWLGHGLTNQRPLTSYAPGQERDVIRETRERIQQATGNGPRGWLGPGLVETFDTPDHLVSEGFSYVCDWGCDDQPLWMNTTGGDLLAMPYQQGLNDIPLFSANLYTGPEYAQAVCDAFDVLWSEAKDGGKVMALPIHPFFTGLPMHAGHFERALKYILGHEGVWPTTSGAIYDWFSGHYPKAGQ